MIGPKVIHLLDWPGFGGIESAAASLARQQGSALVGFVFTRRGPGLARFEQLGKPILIVEDLLTHSSCPEVVVQEFCSRATVLHLHSMYLDRRDTVIPSTISMPVLATLHSRRSTEEVPFPVVCLSASIKEALLHNRHSVIIPNGVDCALFSPKKNMRSKTPVIIRLGRKERVDQTFWPVMHRLWSAGTRCDLWIVGEDGIDAGPIRYFGVRQDVDSILKSGDILLHLPSTLEEGAHDRTVLEAMASGLAVVSTTARSVTESIDDGVSGLLLDPADVDGIAETLRHLITDHPLRLRLGKQARQKAKQRFSLPQMAKRYSREYARTIRQFYGIS